MKFSLIICTYLRPEVIVKLLNSVAIQTLCPNEILIVDGSTDNKTKDILVKLTKYDEIEEKPIYNKIIQDDVNQNKI